MPQALGFPLSFLSPLLARLSVPASEFRPDAEWKSRYRTHCLVGNVKLPNGSVVIERSIDGKGSRLRVRCERTVGPGKVHVISGEVRCAADQLGTPLSWSLAGDSVGAGGARLRTSRSGEARKSRGSVSHEWSLIDAIQRLPRAPFPMLRFSMLTYDGRLLPDQTLTYKGPVEIQAAGSPVRLHAYEHLGTGVLPWIYYTGESGRLLIAASGLQAWVFEEVKA